MSFSVPQLQAGRIGVLVSAACVLLTACEEPPPPPAPEVARPVKIFEVAASGKRGTREYPGQIKAGQYSEMSFEVPGKVTQFVYTEGSLVKVGAMLAKLDPRDYKSRYDSALAKQSYAKAERDRYKAMYDKDVKPYAEYELRLRQYQVRTADTREAKKALDDTVLRAPFEGVMARKLVEEFEQVQAKQAVLILQNDELLEIKIAVPERDLAGRSGDRSSDEEMTGALRPRVQVSSLPGREFPARVKELANVADPTTRTFEATLVFAKPKDANILGGMTAKVIIDIPETRETEGVLVPSIAVVSGGEGSGRVWVVDRETLKVSSRAVELGELAGKEIEVRKGLEGGEWIAASGVHQLSDGMTVRRYER
jgi:RND family efflux transporter MFP subunit